VADHRDLGRADRHRHQVPSAGLRSNTVELALIDVMIQAPSSSHPHGATSPPQPNALTA